MVTAVPPAEMSQARSSRITSVDALRGFALIWLLGFKEVVDSFVCLGNNEARPWRPFFWVPVELKHITWEGFRFFDLLFPLVLFLAGIASVYAVPKWKQQWGLPGTYGRILKRTALLIIFGIVYTGGLRGGWEEVRWLGVLQRTAIATGAAALLFCHLRTRGLVVAITAILMGYWWAMAQIPVPNLTLDANSVHDAMAEYGATNVVEALAKTPDQVRGSFLPGLNLAHYLDALYLPGHRYRSYWDPEGILGTLPSVATVLLGCLAGIFIQRTDLSAAQKCKWLGIAGVALAVAGWSWGGAFPVVKLLWSSSFVLVAAGYSCAFLALFQWATEVKHWRLCLGPLEWVGTNAILLYMSGKLVGFDKLTARLIGSPEQHWIDAHVLSGAGAFLQAVLAFSLMLWLARLLYRHKVALRV